MSGAGCDRVSTASTERVEQRADRIEPPKAAEAGPLLTENPTPSHYPLQRADTGPTTCPNAPTPDPLPIPNATNGGAEPYEALKGFGPSLLSVPRDNAAQPRVSRGGKQGPRGAKTPRRRSRRQKFSP